MTHPMHLKQPTLMRRLRAWVINLTKPTKKNNPAHQNQAEQTNAAEQPPTNSLETKTQPIQPFKKVVKKVVNGKIITVEE